MPITIGSNIQSLGAQRQLAKASDAVTQSYERLSSGMRITKASDDAAGLAISMSLSTDSRIFTQSIRNVNDAISATSIASGATGELGNILIRIKELAEQSANGTFNGKQRAVMNKEAVALHDEYNRIIQTTKFNGIQLLSENTGNVRIEAGNTADNAALYLSGSNLGVSKENDGTFVTSSYTASVNYGVAAGDTNCDGVLDLTTCAFSGIIDTLVGNGDGTYKAAKSFSVGIPVADVSYADVNNDGNSDLILSLNNTDINICISNGDGTFKAPTTITTVFSSSVTRTLGVDINGDGNLDILTIGFGANALNVNYGNGDGTFKATISYAAPGGGEDIQLGDFNADGVNDVVIVGTSVSGMSILLGNADGSFLARKNYAGSIATGGYGVTIGDFNNDGSLDVAQIGFGTTVVALYLNNGNGTFTNGTSFTTGTANNVNSIRAGDFDGDGKLDLIVGLGGNNATKLLTGNNNGTFNAGVTLGLYGINNHSLVIADLNGDGAADFANLGGSGVVVGLGSGTNASTLAQIDISTRSGAYATLNYIDNAQTALSLAIGKIGADESRLRTASATLSVSRENYLAANSRIKDVDVAEESSVLVRTQILQQAGAAILAQTNQAPQLALQLLRG